MERVADAPKQHEHAAPAVNSARSLASTAASASPILQLQQQAGNQVVQQFLRAGFIQAKLATGRPDDPEEHKATNATHSIMRKHNGAPASGACSCFGDGDQCEECQQKSIQRKAKGDTPAPSAGFHSAMQRSSAGHSLGDATRVRMEAGFGERFNAVRIHDDNAAHDAARSVDALAFTVGNDIYFGSGYYQPGTKSGQKLLAHELTHVVQQGRGIVAPAFRSSGRSNGVKIDTSGEANAEQVSENIAAGRPADLIITGVKPSVQRQVFGFAEEVGKIGEVAKIGEQIELPEVRPVPNFEGTPANDNALPKFEGTPANDNALPNPSGLTRPGPLPLPVPQIKPQPQQDEKKDPDCGSKDLPLTMVTFYPGPLGQARRVKASPLTKCPGNTVGSSPDGSVYRDQFDCINAKGQKGSWVRAHLLHGETDKSGPFNLHGPGDIRNLIIADKSINTRMSQQVESPVITGAYAFNRAYWYDSSVVSYVPGKEFFAAAIALRVGVYNTTFGIEGPAIPELCQEFPLNIPIAEVPDCPPTAIPGVTPPSANDAALGVTPPVDPATAGKVPSNDLQFKSTIKICEKELLSREFEVNNGGLEVRVFAEWLSTAGDKTLGPADCPIDHYFVRLEQAGLLWGFNTVSTNKITVGQYIEPLKWRKLDKDKYRLKFYVEGDHPSCCLQGDVAVSTFDSPKGPTMA